MDDHARWTILERVFHAALALDPGERAGDVSAACGEDEDLRRRVDSLLGHDSAPAAEAASAESAAPSIGPYRVLSPLGAGGMGEVYLALDSRLGRRVALKVLPPRFVADPDRRRRFLQEARAASALNHPNIVAVYDIGRDAGIDSLVMEYVPGKPLERLIPQNGLKSKEALGYAIQMAGALACAHGAGIIHRDLKPANIVVTETGAVKVLDFGLAKLAAEAGTRSGTIVGTPAYMSPEQAAGAQVDARSDIFSLGSMLYEMTTGRRPFQRDSAAATLAAVQSDAPPRADAVSDDVPASMAAIIERCLRKDPDERFASAAELKTALLAVPGRPVAARRKLPRMAAGVAVLVAAVAGVLFFAWRNSGQAQPKSSPALAAVPLTTYPFAEYSPAFSPDGSRVAFGWMGRKGDNADIYVKLIGEDEPVQLTRDPLEDMAPAWSPDGHWIAFLRYDAVPSYHGVLFLVPSIGGPERRVADIDSPRTDLPRISWDASGQWLAVADKSSPAKTASIYLVSAHDGGKRRLTFPTDDSIADATPEFSPDGRSIAFVRGRGAYHMINPAPYASDIYVLRLGADLTPEGEPVRLTNGANSAEPAWAADGRSIVYVSGSRHNLRLWRLWLPDSGVRPSAPEPLPFAGSVSRAPAISRQGRFAFMSYRIDGDLKRLELAGTEANPRASGTPQTIASSTRLDHTPQYSPDGSRIAFASDRSGSHEIWVCDREGSNAMQLTLFGGPYTADPIGSPDGRWIAFSSQPEGRGAVFVIGAGGGSAKRLTAAGIDASLCGWSRDGKWIYYSYGSSDQERIWRIPSGGGPPQPVTSGRGNGRAIESPDGRFLFYLETRSPVSSLWRMVRNSGQTEKIVDAVYGFNFAITNTGVFFVADRWRPSIEFLRFADRKVAPIASLGREALTYGISIAPDGRSLLFGQFTHSGHLSADLMLVENFR